MASRLTTLIVVVIVAGTLIAGLIVGAQRDDASGPADLIVTNGRVYTGSADRFAEALAVRGNKILRVGTNRDIKRLRRPQTLMIDAHGAAVLPGFNDAHVHLLDGGLALARLDLSSADTFEGIETRIRDYAAAHPGRPWILGSGWSYAALGGVPPTRQQLDALVADRAVYLTAVDGHTGWANSKALALAHVTRRTPSPLNGMIVKDARTGEPTGALEDAARTLVEEILPEPGRDEQIAAIRAAIDEAHRLGITSVQSVCTDPGEIELYRSLRSSGSLDLRVYTILEAPNPLPREARLQFEDVRTRYGDDPLLKAGTVELVADGAIESRTAALLEPYADAATRGDTLYTPEELDALVADLDRSGWQVSIRAAGDQAVRMGLDAYERAAAANRTRKHERRHRLEQIDAIDPADIPRLASLGVIASQQPFRGAPSSETMAVWSARIGPERGARGWAAGSIQDAGARLAFGSDWPTEDLDPRYGLHAAVTRTALDGTPDGGWHIEDRLALSAAIDAYTTGSAFASFDDLRKGRLERNMLADFVILSSDIFAPDARLLDAVVDTTIFDGRVVYTRTPPQQTD
jgi:predicted amidohydrolase YtcJ